MFIYLPGECIHKAGRPQNVFVVNHDSLSNYFIVDGCGQVVTGTTFSAFITMPPGLTPEPMIDCTPGANDRPHGMTWYS